MLVVHPSKNLPRSSALLQSSKSATQSDTDSGLSPRKDKCQLL